MPLIDIHAMPSASTRRWFGLSASAVLMIFGLMLRTSLGDRFTATLFVAGLVLAALYYMVPSTQIAIIRTWQRVTYPLAYVVGHVLLLTIYFGILTPTAWIARFFRYDPLCIRKPWRDSSSSWHDRIESKDPTNSFRQY